MLKKIKVSSLNKEIIYQENQSLLQTLLQAGINIYANCGGKGLCGKCKIKIIDGDFYTESSFLLSQKEISQNIVLACKTFPKSDLVVEILTDIYSDYLKSLKEVTFSVYEDKFTDIIRILKENKIEISPIVSLLDLNLQKPELDYPISDLENLQDSIYKNEKKFVVLDDIEIIRKIPKYIRANNFKAKILISEKETAKDIYEILELLPLDYNKNFYGLAVDLGTTTVAVSLVDLKNIKTISTKMALNKQIALGEDIITRIIYTEENENGLEELTTKAISTVNELIDSICAEKGISFNDIYVAVFAGNPTMMHLLYKIPPSYIRQQPYVVAFKEVGPFKNIFNFNVNPKAKIYSLPLVASYIGGDVVGGVAICNIDIKEELSAFLDLGTNGEIVVGNKEFLVSAACSCGPAFEGVGVSCGMRATVGAIESIEFKNGDFFYKVIGNTKPKGICGSGLIDIPSELLKAGVIDRSGKFVMNIKEKKIKDRLRINEDGEYEFLLVGKENTQDRQDIVIKQQDIQNIIRSKGAIFHGLYSLLKYLNLSFKDLKKIYISGGFGSFLNIKKAQILGLLPELEEERFVICGNTSLASCRLYLVSKQFRKRVKEVAKKITYLDLSSFPFYMNEYTSSLFIPHTDFSLFPKTTKNF